MRTMTAHSRLRSLPRVIPCIVAVFYAYGALVHILNIASMTGFPWPDAPLKWQILDIVYLVLDVVVVVGLLRGSWIGAGAFFLAAISQIALYTVFRGWVLDVPAAFQRSAEDVAYLDGLVGFHVLTFIAMATAMMVLRMSSTMQPDDGIEPAGRTAGSRNPGIRWVRRGRPRRTRGLD